jgi:hypothetical protein
MSSLQLKERAPTSFDLVTVFDMVAKCAVNEFNGGGTIEPRMMVVTLDPSSEGNVERTHMLPASVTSYFFKNAQSQAHIGPFIDDLLFGHSDTRSKLVSKGVRPDLVVIVNESLLKGATCAMTGLSKHDEVVLVTIHQKDTSVSGVCKIEESTRVCTKGSLNLDSWYMTNCGSSTALH